MRRRLPIALLPCVLIAFQGCAPAEEELGWPQWRGATGQGHSSEISLPTTWAAESPNVRWRMELPGAGTSSPIVSRGRVYVTTATGDSGMRDRKVLAYDAATGERLWETSIAKRPQERLHRMNSSAGPTPATDGERIYAYFGQELAALDLDGNVVWQKNVDPDYMKYSRYAAGSSPLVVDGKIFIIHDKETAASDELGWMAAFDAATGDELWRITWDNSCCSYVTPFPVRREGKLQLLTILGGRIVSFDPEDGRLLWESPQEINQPVAGLVMDGDILCSASGAHNVRSAGCRRLSGAGDATQVEILWESKRGVPETASPLLYGGRFYTVTQKGFLKCIDPLSGEVLWQERLGNGAYVASPVAGDGKIYLTSTWGITTVISADAEGFEKLAENSLDEAQQMSSAALGEGCFVMRTQEYLYCIEEEREAA